MELNTEINKVFGKEMAKLFADTIPETELYEKAKSVWDSLNKMEIDQWGFNKRPHSEIESYIRETILNKLYEKIQEIFKEQLNEDLLEQKAREMVEKARKLGEELIIKELAKNMADSTLYLRGHDENLMTSILGQMYVEIDKRLGGRH